MRWLIAGLIVLACATDGRAQQAPKAPPVVEDWNRVSDLQLLLEHDHRNCTEMAKVLPIPASKPKPYLECMREKGWIRK